MEVYFFEVKDDDKFNKVDSDRGVVVENWLCKHANPGMTDKRLI